MPELSTLGTVILNALPDNSITPTELGNSLLGSSSESDHLIVTGVITPTSAATRVDTEGAILPNDDLTNMLLDNFVGGTLLLLRIVSGARQVTVKHLAGGIGEIELADDADWTLTNASEYLLLRAHSARWVEVGRFWGGQKDDLRAWLGVAGALATLNEITLDHIEDQPANSYVLRNAASSGPLTAAASGNFTTGTLSYAIGFNATGAPIKQAAGSLGGKFMPTVVTASTPLTLDEALDHTIQLIQSASPVTVSLAEASGSNTQVIVGKQTAQTITVEVGGAAVYRLDGDAVGTTRTGSFVLLGAATFIAQSAGVWLVSGATDHTVIWNAPFQVTHVSVAGNRTVAVADSGKTLIYNGTGGNTWTFTGSGLGAGCQGVGRNAGSGTLTLATNRTLKLKGTNPVPIDASFDWEDDGTRLWVTVNA